MKKRDQLQKILDYEGDQDLEVRRMDNDTWRVGYCSQCGCCCRSITITAEVSTNVVSWLEGYKVKVKRQDAIYEVQDEEYQYVANLEFPITCQYLEEVTERNDEGTYYTGRFKCNRYNERPVICVGYPKKLSKWDSCTYAFLSYEEVQWFLKAFEEVEHGKKEKRRILWH